MAIIKKTKSQMKKSLKRHSKKSLKQTKRKTMKGKVMRGGALGVPPVNLAAIAKAAQAFSHRRNKQSEAISLAARRVESMPVLRTKMGMSGQSSMAPKKIRGMKGR